MVRYLLPPPLVPHTLRPYLRRGYASGSSSVFRHPADVYYVNIEKVNIILLLTGHSVSRSIFMFFKNIFSRDVCLAIFSRENLKRLNAIKINLVSFFAIIEYLRRCNCGRVIIVLETI